MNASGSPAGAAPTQSKPPVPSTNSGSLGELPEWLTGILNDADKTELINKQAKTAQPQAAPAPSQPDEMLVNQPTIEQPVAPVLSTSTSWLTDDVKSEKPPVVPEQPTVAQAAPVQQPVELAQPDPVVETLVAPEILFSKYFD